MAYLPATGVTVFFVIYMYKVASRIRFQEFSRGMPVRWSEESLHVFRKLCGSRKVIMILKQAVATHAETSSDRVVLVTRCMCVCEHFTQFHVL